MKKILLLLLLATFSIQAQTLQNPTYGNVKLKNNTTDNTATKVNVQSTDGTINTISKSDLVNVVEVNDVPSLPLTGEAGKIYVVKNINKIYRWNGTFYSEIFGAKGEKGDKGDQGIQGIQGFKGDTGLTGADGAMGVQGPQGIQGIQGETGLRGIQGETGPQGPIGFTGQKGADGTGVSIKGSFDNTSQLPASGADGDAYLINGNLHVWNGTSWVNVGSIQGPQGLIGFTGATGSQGIQGVKGDKGDQGIQGIQGLKGDTGAKGDTGSFNGDITADQVTETATRKFQTSNQNTFNDATSSIQGQLNSKENTFTKNTAFNKNFGTTVGTVVEGGTLGTNAYTSTAFAPITGGAGYIQNGTTQQTANLNISGSGTFGEKIWIKKSSFSTAFKSSDAYIRLGGSENLINGYQFIGFGYNNGEANQVPAYIGFQQTGTGSYTKGDLVFGTRGDTNDTSPSEALRITSSGNVGIGTSTPSTKLDVAGTFNATGAATFSSTVTASPATLDTQLATLGQVKGITDFKVDKVAGKSLIADSEITRLATVTNQDISGKFDKTGGTISGNVNVTGTVTASPATASNHLVTKAQLDASVTSRPYKVYTALLTQSGTNAPTAVVLENTLGGTVVWARSTDGIYYATSGYRFTDNKTTVFINNHRQDSNVAIECTNNNNVSVSTYGISTVPFSGVDGRLLNNAIEIRVYL